MGDEGKLQRMDVDYASTVDEKLPESEKLAKAGKLTEAIEMLLSLEKQTRTGSDAISTGRILVGVVKLCYEAKKWDTMNENIALLSKKRGQLKQAVTKMVQEAITYLDNTPNLETKLKLIDTLRTVTAGKIYVEIERARLTRTLAKIREDEGNVKEAATILQELQVETFGSMEKKEKVEFILEQMRLCLARKDYIRCQIISKKISTKFFDDKESAVLDLKLKYYELMIELDLHEGSYLSICKHYRAILDTPSIQEDDNKRNEALKCVIIYLILAEYDNEQSDLIHRVKEDKHLEELTMYQDMLKMFTTEEVLSWQDLCQRYEQELRHNIPGSGVFTATTDEGTKCWKDFKIRVVEHNIRVMAKYYTRVRFNRMAELLDLTVSETEEFLCKMVVKKTVEAKIDRLAGIVHFRRSKDPNDILNDWSTNATALMQLVNKTTHLIIKEEMIHKLQ